jgi:iron(III) transport system ATP-binding protein
MPRQLSGGEQQRVAVARALAPQPKLVLLDEPFSALDANSRAETRVAVAAALRASGSTAILVTHDQAEAFSAGSQVAILRAGRIAQIAPPEELYRNPADAGIAAFLGDANILPGLARGGIVSCALGELPAAGGGEGEVEILIRPEQIRLATPEAGGGIRATVTGITYFGADASVALALNPDLSLSARVFGHDLPPVGAEIVLHVEGGVTVFMSRPLPCQ